MTSRPFLNRLIIFAFLILIGYCLARGIQYKSVMGILLAIISLGAAVYFVYLLVKRKEEMEAEEAI